MHPHAVDDGLRLDRHFPVHQRGDTAVAAGRPLNNGDQNVTPVTQRDIRLATNALTFGIERQCRLRPSR